MKTRISGSRSKNVSANCNIISENGSDSKNPLVNAVTYCIEGRV